MRRDLAQGPEVRVGIDHPQGRPRPAESLADALEDARRGVLQASRLFQGAGGRVLGHETPARLGPLGEVVLETPMHLAERERFLGAPLVRQGALHELTYLRADRIHHGQ